MRTLKSLAVAVTAAALTLTACGPAQGPAGQVVGKDRTYWSATKQWRYKLTVRTPDGSEHTFRVLHGDYRDCYRGSAYPKCTTR
jgi:predicted small secreted protein